MATKTAKRKQSTAKAQTPREMADELREKARNLESYRNQPEVRRAIARNPATLKTVLEAERMAAEFRKLADKIDADFEHLSDAEFAALDAATDAWEKANPEKAEQARRDAKRMFEA